MWFRKKDANLDLNDEMRFHLEKQFEQNIARGMSPQSGRFRRPGAWNPENFEPQSVSPDVLCPSR